MRWNGVWPGGWSCCQCAGRAGCDGKYNAKHDDDGGATGRSEGRELEGTADGSGSTTMRITKGGPVPLKHEAGENRGQGKGGKREESQRAWKFPRRSRVSQRTTVIIDSPAGWITIAAAHRVRGSRPAGRGDLRRRSWATHDRQREQRALSTAETIEVGLVHEGQRGEHGAKPPRPQAPPRWASNRPARRSDGLWICAGLSRVVGVRSLGMPSS